MLSELLVEDFALVERQELVLEPGLTVFTGETGAGKSILIEALGLALGDRGDSTTIREAAPRTQVSAVFELHDSPEAEAWLFEQGLAEPEATTCILQRSLSRDGRSRAQVNGRPVTLTQLRELGLLLVNIHGQNSHQSLVRSDAQRGLLDRWGNYPELEAQVLEAFRALHAAREAVGAVAQMDAATRTRELEWLQHELETLTALNPSAERLEALNQAHQRAAHAESLLTGLTDALQQIDADSGGGARPAVDRALRRMRELQRYDPRLAEAVDLLEQVGILLNEASQALSRLASDLDPDPALLLRLEQALADWHAAARRHRAEPSGLDRVLVELATRFRTLTASEGEIEARSIALRVAEAAYVGAAGALTQARVNAAPRLAEEVTAGLRLLGMPSASFSVRISEDAARITRTGTDHVEFWVSSNAGQAEKPLAKVASGGEIARIALAIQVVLARVAGVPTLIFDEVDVGIGGRTAEIVGRELRRLGQHRQVLCVTHLAQVAAQGQHHLAVSKQEAAGQTRTSLQTLNEADRVEEIARMLGGSRRTREGLEHAAALLAEARTDG